MSLSARVLGKSAPTAVFDWRIAGSPERALSPVVFKEASRHAHVTLDPLDVQARELQLPSVAAEHIEAIEQRGFAEGFARGEQAARRELDRQYDEAAKQIAATLTEIADLRIGVMRRADRELIHLALAMAERVVRSELKTDPNLFLVIIRRAIERLGERPVAIAHLNPADYEEVVQASPGQFGPFEVVSDTSLPRGSCVIRSALGVIDAGVDAQFRELSREFLAVDSE